MACSFEKTSEALWREARGPVQNVLIVVQPLESGTGVPVDNEGHVRMPLQSGSRHGRRDRTLNGFGDGRSFAGARSQQENSARVQNRADAHRDGALRNVLGGTKEFAVVLDGAFGDHFQARSRTQARGRLVEADVPVSPNAKNLQVDPPGIANGLLVRGGI